MQSNLQIHRLVFGLCMDEISLHLHGSVVTVICLQQYLLLSDAIALYSLSQTIMFPADIHVTQCNQIYRSID